ncbi:hypothetical protein EDB92DRAFT_2017531 [Lactarius akahatsu]|uniref:RNI-like protein n=1 Tax=Lactarius akahatsu TaxID=416441 RepID=A0AAD4LS08_9AGAM|nr:hypothetical protein EDB92DRAFT_2017531 [Lactarius akahatsu]
MNYSIEGLGLKLNTREDIEPYLKQIEPNISQLEEIHLCGNTIGVGAAQALAEVLNKASKIKVVDFADIFTGRLITEIPIALAAICDSLIDKAHIVEINLSDNAFGGRSVEPIVPFLSKNPSFQIFRLNNNGLGPEGGAVIANALRDNAAVRKVIPIEGRSSLRTIICGRNRLEDGSAPAWAEAFAAHGTLVEDSRRMLPSRCSILQDNTLSQPGDRAFAAALSSWPDLHTLNLSDCILSEEGEIPQVIDTLAKGSNPLLRTLQLQNNNLDNATVSVLAGAIGTHLKIVARIEFQENDAEEDDEATITLIENLTARGGKFVFSDEDEEEEEEEEEVLEDAEEGSEFGGAAGKKDEVDREADILADLIDKVSLTGS